MFIMTPIFSFYVFFQNFYFIELSEIWLFKMLNLQLKDLLILLLLTVSHLSFGPIKTLTISLT